MIEIKGTAQAAIFASIAGTCSNPITSIIIVSFVHAFIDHIAKAQKEPLASLQRYFAVLFSLLSP